MNKLIPTLLAAVFAATMSFSAVADEHAKNPCAMHNPCAMKNPCAMHNPCAAKNPCAGKK